MENEHVLKSMKACVSETLSTLGEHFGQLLELALTREVQVSAGWAWRRAEWALLGLEKLWSGLSWGPSFSDCQSELQHLRDRTVRAEQRLADHLAQLCIFQM